MLINRKTYVEQEIVASLVDVIAVISSQREGGITAAGTGQGSVGGWLVTPD